jgi:hypothetical protein
MASLRCDSRPKHCGQIAQSVGDATALKIEGPLAGLVARRSDLAVSAPTASRAWASEKEPAAEALSSCKECTVGSSAVW